ncbi:class I SAM-dependent methyltransferase [archaeon]|nr:class I SAM-dependent methyltransferase [archaeon]
MKIVLDILMHERNKQVLKFLKKGKNILELGCGSAPLIEILQKKQTYTGIDLNKTVIKTLKEKYPKHKFYMFNLEQDTISLKEKYDIILLVAFIEHMKNPDHLFKQIKKMLTPEGKIVLTTPTKIGDSLNTLGAHVGLTSMSAVHDHEKIYNKKDIDELCRRNGLQLIYYKQFEFGLNQVIVLGK